MSEEGQAASVETAQPKKRSRLVRAIAIIAIVLVAFGIYVGVSIARGDITPADAAAKYDGLNYLPESQVSDYIGVYRSQMGLQDSSDEDWATFLAAYNLTPQRLRYSTIQQLVLDALVQKKVDELGLQAADEEIESSVETLRNTLGLGDEEILRQTLEAHGQTEEGLREVYEKAIEKRLLLASEVPVPTPTDDQVKEFMKSFDSSLENPTARHTYCFKLDGVAESGDRDKIDKVNLLLRKFAMGDRTRESFEAMVKENSNDPETVANGGANGWDVDSSGYSDAYLSAMEGLEKGGLSQVFRDGDACCFIWVDDACTLPVGDAAVEELDPADVPESLWGYLSDSAAYELWEQDCDDYLAELLESADVVYYPMPSDVPYNVDMSLADVQLEEVDEGEPAEQSE